MWNITLIRDIYITKKYHNIYLKKYRVTPWHSLKRHRKKTKNQTLKFTRLELEIITSIKTYGVSIPREKATSWLQKMSTSNKMTKQKSKRENGGDGYCIVEVKLKNFSRKT